MARQAVIQIIDDFNGTPADETIEFSIDGVEYTTDLTRKNAAEFRRMLKPWQEAAWQKKKRKTRKGQPGTGRRNEQGRQVAVRKAVHNIAIGDRNLAAKVRAWAKDNGYTVATTGLISKRIQDAYRAAHDGELK